MKFYNMALVDETVKFKENVSISVTREVARNETVYSFFSTKYINEQIKISLPSKVWPRRWENTISDKKNINWRISPPNTAKEINKPNQSDMQYITYTLNKGIISVYLVHGKMSIFMGRSVDLVEIEYTGQIYADPYHRLNWFESLLGKR